MKGVRLKSDGMDSFQGPGSDEALLQNINFTCLLHLLEAGHLAEGASVKQRRQK